MAETPAGNPRGAIATPHHLATQAGDAALRAGGNAVDAALAAAATLCVVYPHNVALGGDLVALVHSPQGDVRFLNATGTAATQRTLAALRAQHGDALPLRDPDTITVPGGIRGWQALHEAAATRSWAAHLADAIRHAETGIPVSSSLARGIAEERAAMLGDPGCREVFFRNQAPLTEADTLLQPRLAETLRRIAEHGPDEFYLGDTAKHWVGGLRALGSSLTRHDLARYTAEWGEPLEGTFHGHRVLTGPPNTSGFILLRALAAIEAGISDPLGQGAGALAEAFRAANAVRAALLADPNYGGASGQELMNASAPRASRQSAPRPNGDTVGLSAVSADGWAVSLIHSLFYRFGACVLEPETGILFQNRGTSFSLDPDSPNVFAGGKRPQHTLMPVLVMAEDRVRWVLASMGGGAQPQIHTQLLLRGLAGNEPAAVTSAPRWIVTEPSTDGVISVMCEANVPESTQQALSTQGFELHPVPPLWEVLGHANCIRVDQNGFTAASDPRSDGSALVVFD